MGKTIISTISKNGFTFEIRKVSIKVDGTLENCGNVEVFAPVDLCQLSEFIDKGYETEEHACKLYKGALAVELQAAVRRSKTSGKMSKQDFDRLFDTLTTDDKCQKFDVVSATIQQLYDAEQTPVDEDEDIEDIEDETDEDIE